MKTFTIDEFIINWDTLFDKVKNGEDFVIKSEYGNVMLTSCKNSSDKEYNVFCDHNDAC